MTTLTHWFWLHPRFSIRIFPLFPRIYQSSSSKCYYPVILRANFSRFLARSWSSHWTSLQGIRYFSSSAGRYVRFDWTEVLFILQIICPVVLRFRSDHLWCLLASLFLFYRLPSDARSGISVTGIPRLRFFSLIRIFLFQILAILIPYDGVHLVWRFISSTFWLRHLHLCFSRYGWMIARIAHFLHKCSRNRFWFCSALKLVLLRYLIFGRGWIISFWRYLWPYGRDWSLAPQSPQSQTH